MYLLDTNIVFELRRQKPHGGVLEWINSAPKSSLFISAVTLGEIQRGIERTRVHDSIKATALDAWVDYIAATSNILPMTGPIFRLWPKLMQKRGLAFSEDTMLAATAILHELVLVTRNTKDFLVTGCALYNPFQPK